MAIQIRRGTNTEWESNNSNIVAGEPAIATDAERFFVGTSSGDYAEFANLDIIAPAYDNSASYEVGDVINRQGKLYSCNTPCSGAFNISYWDEKSLAEILKDLENEIDYAQYEIGYANGELITIDNGASEIPVKDLTLDIDAVQDLHGYDAPWVGGAGKNILPLTENSTTVAGVTVTIDKDKGTITLNGTATNLAWCYFSRGLDLPSGTGILNCQSTNWASLAVGVDNKNSAGITNVTSNNDASISALDTVGQAWVRLSNGGTYSNVVLKPMIRLTGTSAEFAPYTNICPISGWDEVNVCVAGKNQFFMENWNLINGYFAFTDGIKKIIASEAHYIYYFRCKPNTTYTVSKISDGENIRLGIAYSTEKPAVGSVLDSIYTNNGIKPSGTVVSVTATTSATAKYLAIWAYWVTDEATKSTIQLEKGDARTEFVPFANVYTIDLDGTRYGGTLDVTNGVLTVTHTMIDLGSLTYDRSVSSGIYRFQAVLPSAQQFKPIADNYTYANMICENYKTDSWNHVASSADNGSIGLLSTGTIIAIQDNSFTDANAFKTAMSGVKLVGELATPQVVQLTPTQVRTLLGANNLWNQMNSNNELAYRISNALN